MNKFPFIIGLIGIISLTACAHRHLTANRTDAQEEVAQLLAMMSGTFSSEEQARADTLFYNINLVMVPIWEQDPQAKWLYVEQAVTEYIDRPYRQRVYRLSATADGMIESRVFELTDPARYIHAWDTPGLFDQLKPDSLLLREGCAVFLKKDGNCFAGSTHDKDCGSTLRGATYATSKVRVCEDGIVSWDQGWDAEDQQVWGAESQGYIFKRKK
ncbi:MAG: hypothetical protein D6722_04210 [Bacteroidetes bacterium]|nr:MAG: hypothetical protein D6722_04210 [Bacteroidota bacterium]